MADDLRQEECGVSLKSNAGMSCQLTTGLKLGGSPSRSSGRRGCRGRDKLEEHAKPGYVWTMRIQATPRAPG